MEACLRINGVNDIVNLGESLISSLLIWVIK